MKITLPRLTKEEMAVLCGGDGTEEDRASGLKKLADIQRLLTDKEHVRAVDALIPEAMRRAQAKCGRVSAAAVSKQFSKEMNFLAARAGLRSV